MLFMRGSHLLRHASTLQGVVALSSAEAEFYGLTQGAASLFGIRSYFRDWGVELTIAAVWSGSSSGLAFVLRVCRAASSWAGRWLCCPGLSVAENRSKGVFHA